MVKGVLNVLFALAFHGLAKRKRQKVVMIILCCFRIFVMVLQKYEMTLMTLTVIRGCSKHFRPNIVAQKTSSLTSLLFYIISVNFITLISLFLESDKGVNVVPVESP